MPRKFSGPRLSFALKLIAKSAFRPARGVQQEPVLAQADELGITFIGHASFLLQLAGLNILIDPVFAKWLFLIHRLRRPGIRIKDLPPIDAVLLTHAHMDHLNLPSLRRIVRHTRQRGGKAPVAVVPHGVEDLVNELGFSQVNSLQWWESTNVGGVEITMTPSQHWGARVLTDVHRGFGGYVLRHRSHSVYHSGDTGYFNGFAEIRQELSPQIALLPIGAYKPETFRRHHLSPADALRAFLDLKARRLIPMHYGTFSLSEEPMEEPLQLLMDEAKQAGINNSVDLITEGETRIYPSQWNTERGAAQGSESEEWHRSRS